MSRLDDQHEPRPGEPHTVTGPDHADHHGHRHGDESGHAPARRKPYNPFVHDHAHHHHHDDEEPIEALDPAQQSLSDALTVSFGVLKFIMLLLVIAYCFSGVFRVEEQERVVRLWFGQITGEPGEQVYEPGWHFGLPYPIEEKVSMPVAPRSVSIRDGFWYEVSEADAARTADELARRAGPLNPERDGSLLTGDANIVHGRFEVTYRITDPVNFAQNVGSLELADRLVQAAAEQGIVRAVAQIEADAFIRGTTNRAVALGRMQQTLDDLRTGIAVTVFSLNQSTMPLPVRPAYQSVINAENEKAQLIDQARTEYSQTLGATAGQAALAHGRELEGPLLELIRQYEVARELGDQAEVDRLDAALDAAFRSLMLEVPDGPAVPIGGEVAEKINQARTYRTQVVEQTKSQSDYFLQMLDQYRENPRILISRLLEDARTEIFSSENIEQFYAAGQPYIVTNRDPEVQRKKEQRRIQEQQEEVQQERAERRLR